MNNYFDGCYFKLQSNTQTVALIPAFHIDSDNKKSASLQIITDSDTYYKVFDSHAFFLSKNPLRIAIGENLFTEQGIKLNIKDKSLTAAGTIKFGAITPLRYDIMGPFKYLPAMECRHSIFSLTHTVTGSLSINGKQYDFANSVGYIEGDRGRSFPNVYAWTQCNFFDTQPCCVVLSVANIPVGVAAFTGIIGVVLWQGKEYRIATYLGARVLYNKDGTIVVRQGDYTLTARLVAKNDFGKPLFAPVLGEMSRTIKENPSCTAYYRFEKSGKALFSFTSSQAAFEYEYPHD